MIKDLSDEAILVELGERLLRQRIALKLTQAALATKSGVGKRTIERMEKGETAQLSTLIRVLRALDLVERLDLLLPAPQTSPMELLKHKGKQRQRAPKKGAKTKPADSESEWTWGDDA